MGRKVPKDARRQPRRLDSVPPTSENRVASTGDVSMSVGCGRKTIHVGNSTNGNGVVILDEINSCMKGDQSLPTQRIIAEIPIPADERQLADSQGLASIYGLVLPFLRRQASTVCHVHVRNDRPSGLSC